MQGCGTPDETKEGERGLVLEDDQWAALLGKDGYVYGAVEPPDPDLLGEADKSEDEEPCVVPLRKSKRRRKATNKD